MEKVSWSPLEHLERLQRFLQEECGATVEHTEFTVSAAIERIKSSEYIARELCFWFERKNDTLQLVRRALVDLERTEADEARVALVRRYGAPR